LIPATTPPAADTDNSKLIQLPKFKHAGIALADAFKGFFTRLGKCGPSDLRAWISAATQCPDVPNQHVIPWHFFTVTARK